MSPGVLETLDGLAWHEDGRVSLSGGLFAASRRLDAIFAGLAGEPGAAEHQFPDLIPAADLAPIDYLRSFPHLATFATGARRSDESMHAIAAGGVTPAHMDPVRHLLTPAACYHFYPALAGSDLDAPAWLTTNCQCHRREDRYLPLQRQWSFRMREIVCIGDQKTAAEFVPAMQGRIDALASELRLDVAWQTATDPFFDPLSDPKALSQLLEPVKEELCTRGGLALASVNRHRSFFGEAYRIGCGGAAAHSACAAFGIERWLYALIDAHGPHPSAWPLPEPHS